MIFYDSDNFQEVCKICNDSSFGDLIHLFSFFEFLLPWIYLLFNFGILILTFFWVLRLYVASHSLTMTFALFLIETFTSLFGSIIHFLHIQNFTNFGSIFWICHLNVPYMSQPWINFAFFRISLCSSCLLFPSRSVRVLQEKVKTIASSSYRDGLQNFVTLIKTVAGVYYSLQSKLVWTKNSTFVEIHSIQFMMKEYK